MDVVEKLRAFAKPGSVIAMSEIQEAADEIERLRRIIWDLLDDGDETDRAAARAALKGDE